MSIKYTKIKQHPTLFLRLFGVSVSEFERVHEALDPLWQKKVWDSYQKPERLFKLSLEDMLLMTLLYYRSYTTQVFIGYLFGIDDSRVCRLIRRLEPLLARLMALTKRRHLSQEEVESLLIDATEQTIERPQRQQRVYYSGKKKRHTVKTEIRITEQGRIHQVSKSYPGSVYDLALHRRAPPLSPRTRVYVDSGYQGLDKTHTQTELPFKKSKHHPLRQDDKTYNRALSRIRMKVEHTFAQIKIFNILAQRYRNKRKRYNIKFKIVAGLVNLKNGFASF